MAATDPNPYSDPRTWIALLAIILTLFNLVWQFVNQSEQNRRWDMLNAGLVELRNPHFQVFKVVSREEARTKNWGFPMLLYGTPDSLEQLQVFCMLRARDPDTGELIPGVNSEFSIAEMLEELKRKQWNKPAQITKYFRVYFPVKNEGKTAVTDVELSVEAQNPDGTWIAIVPPQKCPRLAAGADTKVFSEYDMLPDAILPKSIRYKVNISYNDVNGKRQHSVTPIVWLSELNQWNYE